MTDEVPPHYIAATTMTAPTAENEQTLERIIRHHLNVCPDCRVWADSHSDDYRKWIRLDYPGMWN
jgi:hypothetical protein